MRQTQHTGRIFLLFVPENSFLILHLIIMTSLQYIGLIMVSF